MGKRRKVAQYTLEGEFIRTFDSANKAGISFGRRNGSDIIAACLFRRNYALGFRWLYEEDMPRAKELFLGHPICHGTHTLEEIQEVAKQYKTKREFRDKHESLCAYAYNHGWINKLGFPENTTHFKNRKYVVYVIPFYETNTVYVGLSDDINRRWEEHKDADAKYLSGALKYSIEAGIHMPDYPLIIEEDLSALEALYFEDFWKKLYKNQGMNVLNIAPTGVKSGSLGGCGCRTSKKQIYEAAQKYRTIKEFRDNDVNMYHAAVKRKILEELNLERAHKKTGTYTEKYCYEIAAKCKTVKELKETDTTVLYNAITKGWRKQYWWLSSERAKTVVKTKGFKIKVYQTITSCCEYEGFKIETLRFRIKKGGEYNGSYYHYLDFNDIEFDIPDFEHRYII